MEFVIPSSKNRNYLSGSDWIINALDYILKTKTCAGNVSQVVLVLDTVLDNDLIQDRLNQFIKNFPVISGSVARDLKNLAPYWQVPRGSRPEIKINTHTMESSSSLEDMFVLLVKGINKPFESEHEHLLFHLIQIENGKSCLGMTFDHRLFDGRGAEMFLNLFQRYLSDEGGSGIVEGFNFTAPAHLSAWMEKFHAGRNVNRKIITLSKTPVAALPVPPGKDKGFGIKLVSLNPEETEVVYDTAYSEAGYLMEMPYLLSVVIKSVHGLFRSRGIKASDYLVPVSIDLRSGKDIKQELFFNHVSYLLFQIPADDAGDLAVMIDKIKKQMYEQIKCGLPKDIQDACSLMRIAPLPLLKKLFGLPFDGKIASFCFSHVGKSSYLFPDLMGIEINNIFHMPRVPVPPGLGFFFNYFNGRLNLVISYLEGLLSDEEVLMLETGLKERLKACQT